VRRDKAVQDEDCFLLEKPSRFQLHQEKSGNDLQTAANREDVTRVTESTTDGRRISSTFWFLVTLYAAARVLQILPGRVPMPAVVALHVFPPAIFALVHGARYYGRRGIIVFVGLILLVGSMFEKVGVHSRFPFGQHYFTDLMGPKIFAVPFMIGVAYVGMAYLSWTLAMIILGNIQKPLVGGRVFVLPMVAAFIMVSWDLSMDPVWATILRAWVWSEGGAYFGVPFTNFMGWYLTVYVIFQSFAFYLHRSPGARTPRPVVYWCEAVFFYAVSAAGNLLLIIPRPRPSVVSDPTGTLWKVSDIIGACVLVTIFTMGVFVVLAWVRLAGNKSGATTSWVRRHSELQD
jgi:uncharacterized membrane protein